MDRIETESVDLTSVSGLLDLVVNEIKCPAVLVQQPEVIVAANAAWRDLFGPGESVPLPSVSQWLTRLDGGEAVRSALHDSVDHSTSDLVGLPDGGTRFRARVTRAPVVAPDEQGVAIVVLSELSEETVSRASPTLPRAPMERLLVRQTLIEERERRRLGRAVHDHVTQLLAQVRRQLADARDGRIEWQPEETIADVDQVIRALQELTSSFSPPVLEDLGLLPAMHWLADYIGTTYDVDARCDDNGIEPRLTAEVRTIAFRALRELAVNAAKHAPESSVVLSLEVGERGCQLVVSDDGPGFESTGPQGAGDSFAGYGLLSIEQQIRAVGGQFEIRSSREAGTRATITLTLARSDELAGGVGDV